MIVTKEHLEKIAESHFPNSGGNHYILHLLNTQLRKAFVEGAMYAFKVCDKNDSIL